MHGERAVKKKLRQRGDEDDDDDEDNDKSWNRERSEVDPALLLFVCSFVFSL